MARSLINLPLGLSRKRAKDLLRFRAVHVRKKSGVGDVIDQRLAETIKLNVDTFNLPNTPAMTDMFSRSFLPPKPAGPR